MTLPLLLLTAVLAAQPPAKGGPPTPTGDKMPLTGLAPSKIIPNLCVYSYRISTTSPECQAHFDQALGYYYSYVWMEAARSFETALRYDPGCAIAYWGLSRALEKWSRREAGNKALLKADELKANASHREQLLILARMQEMGLAPNAGDAEKRKQAAIKTIDELLSLYDDDEEGWYYRAHLAGGTGFGGIVSAVPFYKALLRINPLHPGATHELVHYYEKAQRPALGWIYAENYIKSSPGIPHPFHMQAHLATRLGRWHKTSDLSTRAVELERAYHRDLNVKPREDHQFSHHLEILTISLIHDGRFREARAIKEEAWSHGYRHWLPWFRLHVAERDWDEAQKIIDQHRKTDKVTAAYLAAVMALRQGDTARATAEVQVLQEAYQKQKSNRQLEYRLWETQGCLMCQQGSPDAGLKLIAKAVDRSKSDYSHHAWGNGAYYMECWGIAALYYSRLDVAEEAFLEALAHDPGSVRAALGLQVMCERLGRLEEASRYAELARRCWRRAEVQHFEAELLSLRGQAESMKTEPTVGTPR